MTWVVVPKFTPAGAKLADGHYSRRKVGSPQFMPPGDTLVLLSQDEKSVFGWWRPHPRSGIKSMNGLDGWTCSIFRHTEHDDDGTAHLFVLEAERLLATRGHVASGVGCGPDGMLTYVWPAKIKSENPGYCFKLAGWHTAGRRHACCQHMRRWSADGRKALLHKPFDFAGRAPGVGL